MKYIIYCRKSSEDESRQVQSLETQEKALLDYAYKHNLEVIEVIKESKSAKTDDNRPLFSSMLLKIASGKADAILVHHIDRLSRNLIESGRINKLIENELLKEIRTPDRVFKSIGDLDYLDYDSIFAAQYSRKLSIRVREGIATKLSKGEYPGNGPLGYLNKDGKIYPDPVISKYVIKAFDLYTNGKYSLKQVTEMLYVDGLRSKFAHKKVSMSNVHKLLKNPAYYGAILCKGILYKGIHEPLITKEQFDLAGDIFSGKNKPRQQKHDFLYRGYLTCDVCGCALTTTISKGKYIYYYCTNGKRICDQHLKYVSEPEVDDLVQELMDKFTFDKEKAGLSLNIYIDDFKKGIESVETHAEVVQRQIREVEAKSSRLLDVRLGGEIDQETFSNKQKALREEKVRLELSLRKSTEPDISRTFELLTELKNQGCSLGELFRSKDSLIKEDLLKSVLSNLKIRDGEIASTSYKYPYIYFEKVSKNSKIEDWLGD